MEESAIPEEYYLDPSTSIKDRVFFAARDGLSLTLFNLLYEKSEEEIDELVNQEIKYKNTRTTPLIAAARNGREAVVKILLEKFGSFVKLEHEGIVSFDEYVIEGATALWCAAAAGHLKIVKRLVKAGADVNHPTRAGSTPLRAACYDGRLDIVRYLCRHNADVHKANMYNNTCLMIAAFKGHLPVVQFLIECGARVEEKALCGATALNFAAECGHTDVVEALLDQGASVVENDHGMTPLLSAAEKSREAVVELLVEKANLSRKQIIDGYELLGASFANDKDLYCLIKAYKYLHKAMVMRHDTKFPPILKDPLPPIPAYNYWTESLTIEDVTRLQGNPDSLHMEGLCVRERLLGRESPELTQQIVYRGAVLADHQQFHRCLLLWHHALRLHLDRKEAVSKDLLRFAQVFSQMIHSDVNVELEQIALVLEACSEELRRIDDRLAKLGMSHEKILVTEEREQIVCTTLYLCALAARLLYAPTDNTNPRPKESEVRWTCEAASNLKGIRSRMQQSLLHMAVAYDTPVDDFHTSNVCRFPCMWTAKFFISCGFEVDALDLNGRSPLLLALVTSEQSESTEAMSEALCGVVCELIAAGAHTDQVDNNGITPLCASIGGPAEALIRASLQINLTCLSANMLAKEWKTYDPDLVPWTLHNLLELHGIRKRKS